MYRNTYLQLYKSSASHEQNPTILLAHFSQIYNTLGYVLQDLEYHIGRLQLQNNKPTPPEISPKQTDPPMPPKINNSRKTEREIVKIEDSSDDPPNKKGRISDKEDRQVQLNTKKMQLTEKTPKQEEAEPQSIVAKIHNAAEKAPRQYQSGDSKGYTVHAGGKPFLQSDSFDELFGQVGRKRADSERVNLQESEQRQRELPAIPQSQGHNTYDDFMQRIFKEGTRKSK